MKTLIRLLLQEQSDLGLYGFWEGFCNPFKHLKNLDHLVILTPVPIKKSCTLENETFVSLIVTMATSLQNHSLIVP